MSQPAEHEIERGADGRQRIRAALEEVRRRTLDLISPLSPDALARQHSTLMSPIIWDLAHIAEFEELWLVRRTGRASDAWELDESYDAMRIPRSRRGSLDLPDRRAVLERLARVRAQTVRILASANLLESDDSLLRDGFVYELVREHEAQHQETILQTIALMESETYRPVKRVPAPEAVPSRSASMIRVPAGAFAMGAGASGFAYDNERPPHEASTGAFEIGRYPVTNAEYVDFLAAGGYLNPSLWSDEGWAWCHKAELAAPQYWTLADSSGPPDAARAAEAARADGMKAWRRVNAMGSAALSPHDPVSHVCHHEAYAFARFAGARLPTEVEWEKAAAFDPDTGVSFPFPWGEEPPTPGRANLDQRVFDVAPVGAYPDGRSPLGCEQLLGDVWEWTDSRFTAYPGFRAYPYDEYSAVFFGDEYVVLRGASWATDSGVARNTFRNWDYPIRRQIFAGFRLARDL